MERLLAANVKTDTLNKAALESAGLLGLYKKHEFDALVMSGEALSYTLNKPNEAGEILDEVADWSFEYIPSHMDQNTGRVKMRPKNHKAAILLDRGRAYKISNRNKKAKSVPIYNLIGYVQLMKRSNAGGAAAVQDFIINHYDHHAMADMSKHVTKADDLLPWLTGLGIDTKPIMKKDFREAVFTLMGPAIEVLNRKAPGRGTPKSKPAAKHGGQGKGGHQRKHGTAPVAPKGECCGNCTCGNVAAAEAPASETDVDDNVGNVKMESEQVLDTDDVIGSDTAPPPSPEPETAAA